MSRTDFDPPRLRGTGRTTQQMQDAPKGAIFVWVNQCLGYPRDLAANLGRDDLVIVPPSYLDTIDKLAGRTITGILLDHATKLTDRQFDSYWWALTRGWPWALLW